MDKTKEILLELELKDFVDRTKLHLQILELCMEKKDYERAIFQILRTKEYSQRKLSVIKSIENSEEL